MNNRSGVITSRRRKHGDEDFIYDTNVLDLTHARVEEASARVIEGNVPCIIVRVPPAPGSLIRCWKVAVQGGELYIGLTSLRLESDPLAEVTIIVPLGHEMTLSED
jgi:hypothetical protein